MSLRKGHFKKVMLSPEQLALEAVEVHPKLVPIIAKWKTGIITDAEIAGLYIVAYVRHRHPHHWISGKLNLPLIKSNSLLLSDYFNFTDHEKNKIGEMTLSDFFAIYNLRSVPKAVNIMMLEWLNGLNGIILLENVPLPKIVLKQQQQGKRCATMITDQKLLSAYIIGERDALGFLIHDLQHAERFFSHHETQAGQVGFYHFIDTFLENEKVQEMMERDTQFREEFEYAMSDMNAYCVHLLKYFTSAFREASKRLQRNCVFLETIQKSNFSDKIKKLIQQVYHLQPISTEETLELQKFFEDFSERGHVSQGNTYERVP